MIQKIKRQLMIVSTALMMVLPPVMAGTIGTVAATGTGTGACTSGVADTVKEGVNQSVPGGTGSVSCASSGVGNSDIETLAKNIITTFSIIVGAASVIMIIYGGFRYIISGGESSRVGAAKTSLIYAVIGLIIVALAQLIIHFVLSQTNNLGT